MSKKRSGFEWLYVSLMDINARYETGFSEITAPTLEIPLPQYDLR
jgi:hypothetical protein